MEPVQIQIQKQNPIHSPQPLPAKIPELLCVDQCHQADDETDNDPHAVCARALAKYAIAHLEVLGMPDVTVDVDVMRRGPRTVIAVVRIDDAVLRGIRHTLPALLRAMAHRIDAFFCHPLVVLYPTMARVLRNAGIDPEIDLTFETNKARIGHLRLFQCVLLWRGGARPCSVVSAMLPSVFLAYLHALCVLSAFFVQAQLVK